MQPYSLLLSNSDLIFAFVALQPPPSLAAAPPPLCTAFALFPSDASTSMFGFYSVLARRPHTTKAPIQHVISRHLMFFKIQAPNFNFWKKNIDNGLHV